LSVVFAAAAAGPGCAEAALLPLVIVSIFYFLLWRPQQKQAAELQSFRDGLKDGDRVITSGGLHGRIDRVDGTVVELEVAPKVRLRVERSQIVRREEAASPASKS